MLCKLNKNYAMIVLMLIVTLGCEYSNVLHANPIIATIQEARVLAHQTLNQLLHPAAHTLALIELRTKVHDC